LNNEYVIHAESPEEELSELAIQSLQDISALIPASERLAQATRMIAQEVGRIASLSHSAWIRSGKRTVLK